jgi:predicted DNA-binding mobile mystery protein A
MKNNKRLALEHLDKKLRKYKKIEPSDVPEKGWIHSIRKSLNMTMEQLGKRLNMTRQGIKKIEEREESESISLKSLNEVAKALDLKLVYGFAPINKSLAELVEQRAKKVATRIVERNHQHMKGGSHRNNEKMKKKEIAELTRELIFEMKKSLWD